MERKDRGARQSRNRRSFESRSPLRAVTDGEFKRREPPDLSAFRPAKKQQQDPSVTVSEREQTDDKLANSAVLPVAAAGKSTMADEPVPTWIAAIATAALAKGAFALAVANPLGATIGVVIIVAVAGNYVAMQYISDESQWTGVEGVGDITIAIPDGADESWLREEAGNYIDNLLSVGVTLTDVGQQDFSTIFGGGSGGNLLTLGESSTATARATDNPFDVDDIYEGVLDDTLLDAPLSQFPSPTELPDATGSQAIDSAIPQIDTYSQPGIDSTNASIPNSDRADAEAEDLLRRRTQQLSSLGTYYEGILVQYGQSPQQSEALEALKSKLTPEQAADLERDTGTLTDQFRTLAWQTGTSYSSANAAGAAEAAEQSLLLRNYREGAEIAFFGRSLSAEERVAFDAFYEGLADTIGVDRKADDNFEKFERRAPDASDRTSSLWISVRNSVLQEFYSWAQVMAMIVTQEPEQQVYVFPPGNDSSDTLGEPFPSGTEEDLRQEPLGGFDLGSLREQATGNTTAHPPLTHEERVQLSPQVLTAQIPRIEDEDGVNWAWTSGKTFGHTFIKHGAGARNTRRLTDLARKKNEPQGQWLDNPAAADFIRAEDPEESPVEIPPGLGQVIMPDGSIQPATKAILVPHPRPDRMYITAYPVL